MYRFAMQILQTLPRACLLGNPDSWKSQQTRCFRSLISELENFPLETQNKPSTYYSHTCAYTSMDKHTHVLFIPPKATKEEHGVDKY